MAMSVMQRPNQPPHIQRQLRCFVANGELESLSEKLKLAEDFRRGTLSFLKASLYSKVMTPSYELFLGYTIDYVYRDDYCNRLILYLCGAQPKADEALWSARCEKIETQNDEQRAKLLQHLFDSGYEMSLDVMNSRRQGVYHFCVVSNSVKVLQTINKIALSPGFPKDRRPDIHLQCAERYKPLDRALQGRQFECIRLLMAAGAIDGMLTFAERRNKKVAYRSFLEPFESMPNFEKQLKKRQTKKFYQLKSLLVSTTSSQFPMKAKKKSPGRGLNGGRTGRFGTDTETTEEKNERGNTESSHRSLNTDQLIQSIESDLETVKQLTGLHESQALTLWINNGYDISATEAAATSLEPIEETVPSSICCSCFEEEPDIVFAHNLPCGHRMCDICWTGYLDARLDDGCAMATYCPVPGCHLHVPISWAEDLLPASQLRKFQRFMVVDYVHRRRDMKWCPRPNCEFVFLLPEASDGATTIDCPCNSSLCVKCLEPSHEPALCHQAAEWKLYDTSRLADKASLDLIVKVTVPCPRCRFRIKRDGGCNHVTCVHCRQQFCYHCGRKWKGHSDHYTCHAKRRRDDILKDKPKGRISDPPQGEILNLRCDRSRRTACISRRRLQKMRGLWSMLDGVFHRRHLKSTYNRYHWYLKQQGELRLEEKDIKSCAHYIVRLLRETLPDMDIGPTPDEIVPTDNGLGYVYDWMSALFSASAVLSNSFILAFYLKEDSVQLRYLTELQQALDSVLYTIRAQFTNIPGYAKIAEARYDDPSQCTFKFYDCTFRDQFTYCHALHKRRKEMGSRCSLAKVLVDQMIDRSRQGAFTLPKPYRVHIPKA